jgi:hypothetical protein
MFNSVMFDKDMVCHYTSKDKAISILNGKQINFSPLVSCDDPRESKQWNFDFIGNAQRICLENYKEALNVFDDSIKNNSMILGFCGWNNEEMNFEKNAIPHYRQDYYRVGFARSRMWSQYGVKHTGVCLVFDRKNLEDQFKSTFETDKKFTGKVEYQYHLESFVRARKIECRNILRHGVDKALKMQIDKYFHEYFFLKLMDYRDEHEYRLVVIVDGDDSIGLPIESSLKGIIVGIDFPRDKYKCIDALAQNCNSSVERWYLSWQEGRPQLQNLWELLK